MDKPEPITGEALRRLLALMGSPDKDVADAALAEIIEDLYEGRIALRPLSAEQRRVLREIFDTVMPPHALH